MLKPNSEAQLFPLTALCLLSLFSRPLPPVPSSLSTVYCIPSSVSCLLPYFEFVIAVLPHPD